MSRSYEMSVRIYGANPDRVEAVKEAAESEWEFDKWCPLDVPEDPRNFASVGRSDLYGDEGEAEFVKRLSTAIWKANGGYCEVEVRTLYLDCLPYEWYSFDEDRYRELVGGASGSPDPDLPQPLKENQHG